MLPNKKINSVQMFETIVVETVFCMCSPRFIRSCQGMIRPNSFQNSAHCHTAAYASPRTGELSVASVRRHSARAGHEGGGGECGGHAQLRRAAARSQAWPPPRRRLPSAAHHAVLTSVFHASPDPPRAGMCISFHKSRNPPHLAVRARSVAHSVR